MIISDSRFDFRDIDLKLTCRCGGYGVHSELPSRMDIYREIVRLALINNSFIYRVMYADSSVSSPTYHGFPG